MSQIPTLEDNEIDLGELFAVLWSHKFLIALFTGLSIVLSGHFMLITQKKFTAKAVFQIQEENNGPMINLRELGALASLAGVSSGVGGNNTTSEILLERAEGREFIIRMKDKSSLFLDPYFNNSDYEDPFWLAKFKQIIGWQKTEQEKNAITEKNILENYRKNVEFEETKRGALSISVTHVNPKKASEYANAFMEEIRRLVEDESITAQELRLNYLSSTLADALQDMEFAQKNLKDYALENSAMAQENFISDSLKLNQLRMEQRKVKEIADLLSIIESFIRSGNLDDNSYEALRSSHPLVDDIQFRRILGMSETISAWSWPDIDTIVAVRATLNDRIKRLDVDISNNEENAQIYATSAEDLVKYKRNAKIAEATYTVLIEQVKSQSLAAGFQPETFKVFEYATPPLEPSFPNRLLVLVLGTTLGIFIGCSLALFNASRRDVYYKRSNLLSDMSAELNFKSKFIRQFAGKSIPEIVSLVSKRRIVALDVACLKLANKKVIYVLNCGRQPSATNTARLLASHSAQSGKKVLLCDATGQTEKAIKEKLIGKDSDLPFLNIEENISVMREADVAFSFTSVKFNSTIKELIRQFDQIFVCSSSRNGQLGLTALAEFIPGLVVISGLRRTKKSDIKNITTIQPVDLLFHD